MERYAEEVVGGEPCMVPSEAGGWVLYEDAILAIQAEREACAKVCEGLLGGAVQTNEWWSGFKSAMRQCAAAIRARR